ncbi:MAG: hypothetical protein KC736_02790 [Candidatus Moranbacteria bacterium]|nr:hypothetical protein [Candidatus Moranbacteria bacterium]
MKHDVSEQITDRIKREHIIPRSRTNCLLRRFVFWFLLFCVSSLGVIFFSLILLNVSDLGFDLARQMHFLPFMHTAFLTLPYVLGFLFLFFLVLCVFLFRNTRHGYRYNLLLASSIITFSVFSLGVGAHVFHLNRSVDEFFARTVPRWRTVTPLEHGRWYHPSEGVLGGVVTVAPSNGMFILRSPDNIIWTVTVDGDTQYIGRFDPLPGRRVGVLGEQVSTNVFHAHMVRPLLQRQNHEPDCLEDDFEEEFSSSRRRTGVCSQRK